MKQLTFYFDVISPYAYLAFEQLPVALKGLSYSVRYQPILFAGVLQHFGQLGPAEIAPKRDWTYRHILWTAQQLRIPLQFPAAHPFNPLALQRLAVAAGKDLPKGLPNRMMVARLFEFVWSSGLPADDAERFQALCDSLAPAYAVDAPEVKQALKTYTENAIANGVFGVPTIEVDEKLFFGLESLPMLAAYLRGDAWFLGDTWGSVEKIPVGVSRRDR